MKYSLTMAAIKSTQYVDCELQGQHRRSAERITVRTQELREWSTSINIFHNIELVNILQKRVINEAHNPRMIDALECVDFSAEALDSLRGAITSYPLQRILAR